MAAPWVVSDELWARIEPLLPVRPSGRTGPKPLPDRQGILFVLFTGIGWEDLPQELGFGSGMTCWRRLRDWQEAGVFDQLHQELLAELDAAREIDWSRACVDASHIRAKGAFMSRVKRRRAPVVGRGRGHGAWRTVRRRGGGPGRSTRPRGVCLRTVFAGSRPVKRDRVVRRTPRGRALV